MVSTTAMLDLTVWRNDDVYEFPLRVIGPDLTGLALRAQIRLAGDTPGPADIALAQVTNANAEGVRLAAATFVNGRWVNDVRIRINKSTRQGLGYSGVAGGAKVMCWAFQIAGKTRIQGRFILPPHVIDSDAATASVATSPYGTFIPERFGAPDAGATLTIAADSVAELVIDGADLLGGLTNDATNARDDAQKAATRALAAAMLLEANGVAAADSLGEDGFCVDAEALTARGVAVRGNDQSYDGDLRSWLPASVFPNPKLVTNRLGETVWTPHNIVYATSTLNAGSDWIKSFATVADAVATPTGNTASRLTATNATASVRQGIAIGAANIGDKLTVAVVASPGTGDQAGRILRLVIDGAAAYFDLLTGIVSNVSAGVTAQISRYDADGTALPSGEWLCAVTGAWSSGSANLYIGVTDSAGADDATAGRNIFVRQPRAVRGTQVMPFLSRGGFPAAMPVGAPYDWSRKDAAGVRQRRILIDPVDMFQLTTTLITAPGTVYLEGEIETAGTNKAPTILEVGTGSALTFITHDRTANAYPDPYMTLSVINAGTAKSHLGVVGDLATTTTIAVALRLQSGQIMAAVNGDLSCSIYKGAPGFDHLSVGGVGGQVGCRFYLKKLVGLTRIVSDRELSSLQDAERLHPAVVSSAAVVPHKNNFASDHGTRAREPAVTLLGETADRAYLLVTSHQKWGETDETYHGEAPVRLLYRTYEVARSGQIVAASDIGVFDQPAGWSSGKGHMLGRIGVKLRTGARRGQTLCLWSVLSSANQTFDPVNPHTVYGRYITDNARGPLPAPFAVLTTETVQATDPTAKYIITDPSGSLVEFPADSDWPGRVVFVAYTDDGKNRSFYSDSQGAAGSWKLGGVIPSIAGYVHNESNLVLLPNGWLLNINRLLQIGSGAEPANIRDANLSKDGGVTWEAAIAMPDFIGAQVSGGISQVDQGGDFGTLGRVAFSRAVAVPGIERTAVLISHYGGPALAPIDQFYAQPRLLGCGYSSIASLFGGRFLALGVEIANRAGLFNDIAGSSTFLKIIDPSRGRVD